MTQTGDRVRSVAKTPTTRQPAELPNTVGAFLRALFWAVDEGPMASRGGVR